MNWNEESSRRRCSRLSSQRSSITRPTCRSSMTRSSSKTRTRPRHSVNSSLMIYPRGLSSTSARYRNWGTRLVQRRGRRISTWLAWKLAAMSSTRSSYWRSRPTRWSICRRQSKSMRGGRPCARRSGATWCRRILWTARGPKHSRYSSRNKEKHTISYSPWRKREWSRQIMPYPWRIPSKEVKIRNRPLSSYQTKYTNYMKRRELLWLRRTSSRPSLMKAKE